MERQIIDLFTLQTALKNGIESAFPSKVWLKAEISSLKCKQGGHCYMDLSQTDAKGALTAQIKAIVWASRYTYIEQYFRKVTGTPLQSGITVLLFVRVNYSQLYGLSLYVDDIDPEYTLGDKERVRRETIARLEREGLIQRQKGLEVKGLPRRIAVISARDAAGFGDFMRHVGENPYGFALDIALFPATMQGASCPDSVISAMEDILTDGTQYDIVLILRGGGSDLDLACFDDYTLCAGIARFPLPVYTAIGHDRDYHVADMVAHEHAKTPTALADMIVDWYADEDARLLDYAARLRLAFTSKISILESRLSNIETKIDSAVRSKFSAMETRIDNIENRIRSGLRSKVAALETMVDNIENRIRSGLRSKVAAMEDKVTNMERRIRTALSSKLTNMKARISMLSRGIRSGLRSRVSTMASRVSVLEAKIYGSDPRRILERGYVLAVDAAGVALRGVAGHERGEKVSLVFPDGAMRCTVDDIILRGVPADDGVGD